MVRNGVVYVPVVRDSVVLVKVGDGLAYDREGDGLAYDSVEHVQVSDQ